MPKMRLVLVTCIVSVLSGCPQFSRGEAPKFEAGHPDGVEAKPQSRKVPGGEVRQLSREEQLKMLRRGIGQFNVHRNEQGALTLGANPGAGAQAAPAGAPAAVAPAAREPEAAHEPHPE